MRFKRFVVLFGALIMVLFCIQLQNNSLCAQRIIQKDSPEVKAFINECRAAIQTEMEKSNTPGISIAVVWHGLPVWMESFGSSDDSGKKEVTNNTIFGIQSLSKQITVVAILIAVRDGILDLDIPISQYLPDYTLNSPFEARPQDKITLRHLLAHRAGLAHHMPDVSTEEAKTRSLEQQVMQNAQIELICPVGEKFSYSNIGYDLAGYILQKVSGEPFGRYVERKVFRPLGMKNSSLVEDKIRNCSNRAYGNYKETQEVGEVPAYPSCGVYSDIEDMVKFIQFHVNGGKVNGRTILKQELLKQMYEVPFDESGKNEGYALGVGAFHRGYHEDIIPIFVHSGDGYGFSSDIFYAPAAGMGTVILTNQNDFDMRWRGQLEDMIYRHLGERLEFIQ